MAQLEESERCHYSRINFVGNKYRPWCYVIRALIAGLVRCNNTYIYTPILLTAKLKSRQCPDCQYCICKELH